MSQTVCPSCGASFMTPWPQCPICGAAIPAASGPPPESPFAGSGDAPSGSFDSSEPFVPPAYDSPIPAPAPSKPRDPAAPGSSPGNAAPGADFGSGFPGGIGAAGFAGADFGAANFGAASAFPGANAPAAPSPAASAAPSASASAAGSAAGSLGGFDFDPARFDSPGRGESPAGSSRPASSATAPAAPPAASFAKDDDLGFDPSSFKSFDFTALDSSSQAVVEPPPSAPSPAAAIEAPAAFRGSAPTPGAAVPPPAFRAPAPPNPAASSAAAPAVAAEPGRPVGEVDAAPKPGEFPSSFSDLNSPANRGPQARRGPPPAAFRGQNPVQEASSLTGDDALSTAGLAPVRTDDKTFTERALELKKGQSEQKQRTGALTLVLTTLLLVVLAGGAAVGVMMAANQRGLTGEGTAVGTGATIGTAPVGTGAAPATTIGSTPAVAIVAPIAPVKIDEETELNVTSLRTAPADVAGRASDALVDKGAAAVPALIPVLSDSQLSVRILAASTFRRLGPQAVGATEPLLGAFDAGPVTLQAEVGRALTAIGSPAAAGLASRYDPNSDLSKRLIVVQALDGMGPAAEPAVPKLVEALMDKDERVRTVSLSALKKVGPAAFPAVHAALDSPTPATRQAACEYMSNQGATAVAAVPALLERLSDGNDRVRDYAQHALGRMGAGAVQPLMAMLTKNEDENVRHRISLALGRIGEPAIDDLIAMLTTAPPGLALYCAQALGEMGPRAQRAVEPLAEAARKGHRDLRFYADEALRKIKN
ncbi:MAG TPA: HEAT repeat domain-containing protein [Pirellulales bacterium]